MYFYIYEKIIVHNYYSRHEVEIEVYDLHLHGRESCIVTAYRRVDRFLATPTGFIT